mmetsp:Transcript_14791/g.44547  ORF Transcript_14791/g.44547 Transcript_14791/m.44547 type:complete len:252 (-) Transcript_14791:234-989(-)
MLAHFQKRTHGELPQAETPRVLLEGQLACEHDLEDVRAHEQAHAREREEAGAGRGAGAHHGADARDLVQLGAARRRGGERQRSALREAGEEDSEADAAQHQRAGAGEGAVGVELPGEACAEPLQHARGQAVHGDEREEERLRCGGAQGHHAEHKSVEGEAHEKAAAEQRGVPARGHAREPDNHHEHEQQRRVVRDGDLAQHAGAHLLLEVGNGHDHGVEGDAAARAEREEAREDAAPLAGALGHEGRRLLA